MVTLFEFVNFVTQGTAQVLVDAGIKSAVVLLAAAIAARLLQRSSAAVRHRVWSLALAGALVMPLLSFTVPQLRLPVLPPATAGKTVAASVLESETPERANRLREGLEKGEPADRQIAPTSVSPQFDASSFQDASQAITAPAAADRSKSVALAGGPEAAFDYRAYAVGVWGIGLFLVLTPLAAGFGVNRLLLRKSRRLENDRWVNLVADLSARIGLTRAVATFESPQPVVPMTWGFLRPTVLVPVSWRDWSDDRRRCVLLHELAHVKRLDVLFQLLGRLAVGVHWFNPLAWHALRQLRIERELACDDCVLAAGERASDYASELVQIARLYRPHRLAVAIAMAQSARLDQRVLGILDEARPRLPVSPKLARCLVAVAAAIVFAVAATNLVEKSASADDASAQTPATQEANQVAQAKQSDARVVVKGTVVAPDGKPVSGARVYAHEVTKSSSKMGHESVRILAETTTHADGTFALEYTKPTQINVHGINQWARRHQGMQFVAMADGYAVGFWSDGSASLWARGQFASQDSMRIQLAPEESLSGRLVDLEGGPVAGAIIDVKAVAQASEPLDEWFQAAVKNPRPEISYTYTSMSSRRDGPGPIRFPSSAGFAATGTLPPVQTDAQGRFSIPNIGADRLVVFEVTSPKIAKTTIKMVTHRGPDVFDTLPDPFIRDSMIHGAQATLAIEPANAIKGQVVDAENGTAIPGCLIEVTQVAGSIMSIESFESTMTDNSGRYMLGELPPDPPNSRGYTIRLTPPAGTPYFPTDYTVRIRGGTNETIFDVRLRQARLISGRIIDQTGQPVRAMVGYLPMLENKVAADYSNFNAGMHTMAFQDFRLNEPDGSYRVPATNGRGVLCVAAEQMAAYALSGQADKIEGLQRGEDKLGIYHLMNDWMVNEFREVNLGPNDPNPTMDIVLQRLSQRSVRLIDVDGQPVIGARCIGQMPDIALAARQTFQHTSPLETSETDIVGLEVESPRALAFLHPTRNIGATAVVRVEDPNNEPLTVTLRPLGRIRGRLTDNSGKPLAGVQVHGVALPPVELPKAAQSWRGYTSFPVYTESVRSKPDGSFEIEKVVPGIRYKLNIIDNKPPIERPINSPAPPEPPAKETSLIEAEQTLDLGDVKIQ